MPSCLGAEGNALSVVGAVAVEIHHFPVVNRAIDLPDLDSKPARARLPAFPWQRKLNVEPASQFAAHVGGVNEATMLGECRGKLAQLEEEIRCCKASFRRHIDQGIQLRPPFGAIMTGSRVPNVQRTQYLVD
jgi:hypothetical protein